MDQSPPTFAFDGNAGRTPSTLNAGLNLHTLQRLDSSFSFTPAPMYPPPIADMYGSWPFPAFSSFGNVNNDSGTVNNDFGNVNNGFDMGYPGGLHGVNDGIGFSLGDNVLSMDPPGDSQYAINNIDPNLATPTDDVDGEHESDVDNQLPTPPAEKPAPKKGKKGANSNGANSKKTAGRNTAKNNKTEPNANKITKSKSTPKDKSTPKNNSTSKDKNNTKTVVEPIVESDIESDVELSPEEQAQIELKKALAKKQKKATTAINKQKKLTTPAQKMGTYVTITHSQTGVVMEGVFWKNPDYDATIPSTDAEISTHIDELVDAIINNQDCREQTDTKQFINRWAAGASHYARDEIKMLAREIVVTMIDIHQNGWTKAIFDKDHRELFQKTMYYTFEERFNEVVELLTVSKRSCNDLMKGERLYAIIGNPGTLTTRTKSNKNSNAAKGRRVKIGADAERAALGLQTQKQKKRGREEDETEEGQAQVVQGARKVKRPRVSRTA